MVIFEHILFWIKPCSLVQKISKDNFSKTYKFTERVFFEKLFCLENSEKDERQQKNRIEKEERDNTTNAKK